MAKYVVEQMAQVWYRVEIEVDDTDRLDVALGVGMLALLNGEGTEVHDSFEWQDETYIDKIEDNN